MKIALSLLSEGSDQFTGTRRYVTELVRELASPGRGINVELLCNDAAWAYASSWQREALEVRRAERFRAGGGGASRLLAIADGMVRPGRLARQISADVDLVQYPLIIPLPRVDRPSIVCLHDILHRDRPELFSRTQLAWRRVAYDNAARSATLVMTLSEHSRERIVEHLGIPAERIVPIPLAVDHDRFTPQHDEHDETLADRFGLPDRFLLYPASLWAHKNHDNLLRALARVEDRDLHLVLTGATFDRLDGLLELASRLGLPGRVHHLGFVPDDLLPALYRRATGLAFASRYEGFGAPPLEAMACGCPVASSFAASLREVCGDAAVELDPDDEEQMATVLTRLACDDELREDLAARGPAQAARFSWAATADAHVAAYRRVVEMEA